jgi:hypothetical protein
MEQNFIGSKTSQTDSMSTPPCSEFVRIDVASPEQIANFILWLSGWTDETKQLDNPEVLLETLWSWDGAPRKRMAKLCWQTAVQNSSEEYFDQHFTLDLDWLTQQLEGCGHVLGPIQQNLRWVLQAFENRRKEDTLLGQGSWGEEWYLPTDQAAYVREQLRRSHPALLEESSNYEDALTWAGLPYFEVVCEDQNRSYVGNHLDCGRTRVFIEDSYGEQYPLNHARHPFQHSPGTNFSWGYGGRGPSELALSILADTVKGDLALAETLLIPFVDEVLTEIPWTGNLRVSHQSVLDCLEKNVDSRRLDEAADRVRALKSTHGPEIAAYKERWKQTQEMGGLRMQRFDIVAPDFESALYVDLMRVFERGGWVLHCTRCGLPVACEKSPRGNRQRARWIAGRPIYHKWCFREQRLDHKRKYWVKRTGEPGFRASERERARKRRML